MRRRFLLKSLLLLCALIAGSSSVWAIDFIAGTDTGSTSVTKDGVTVSMSTMSRDDNYRTYANTSMTVSSTAGNISSIIITCTGSGTNDYGPGKFSGDGYTYSGTTGTWSGSATSVSLSASAQVRITKIVVSLEGSGTSYTITAESNNTTWGTVALSGTTITATPASGYQVSSSTPYQVTAGTATVTQTGNAFSVTPSSDCTIRINFEAIPTYTITINAPENGTLSVKLKSDDSDVNDGDQYPAGTVLKITATPNDGYNFKNIQVIDASTHTFSASNTREYELTASNTIIKANFEAKVYHNVNWYVNGTISSSVSVEEGTAITKPATDPANIGGKRFMGWVDTAINGTTNTAPTFFTTANMGTTDVNYYAVFATVDSEGPDTYAKITSSTLDTNESYVLGAEQSSTVSTMWYFSSYDYYDKNTSWGKSTNTPATVSPLKLTLSGTASSLIVQDENGKYLVPWSGNFRMESASTNATISINDSGVLSGTSASTTSNPPTVNLRYNYNNGNGGFRWYDGSTGTQAYLYKVIPGTTYSDYCTTVISDPSDPEVSGSTVTLTTTANMDGWRSFYDATKDYEVDANTTIYVAAVSETAGSVTLTPVAATVIPHGEAVILKTTDAGHSMTLTETTGAETLGANVLTVTDGNADADGYRLGYKNGIGVAFFKYTATAPSAGIVYIAKANVNTGATAPEFLTIGGETTGINTLNVERGTLNGEVYNLNGQRVAQPTKGLYIVNGRKVVVK